MLFGDLDECWEWESVQADVEGTSDEEKGKFIAARLFRSPDEAFVIRFDMQGKVSKCRPPKAGPYASLYKEQDDGE